MMKGISTQENLCLSGYLQQACYQARYQTQRNTAPPPPSPPPPKAATPPQPLALYGPQAPEARKDEAGLQVLPLGRLKGLIHKVWKDLSSGDMHALLKDVNHWLEGLWKPGGLRITGNSEFSLDFELDLEGLTKWKGQAVAVDFHLELHLEQTWTTAEAPLPQGEGEAPTAPPEEELLPEDTAAILEEAAEDLLADTAAKETETAEGPETPQTEAPETETSEDVALNAEKPGQEVSEGANPGPAETNPVEPLRLLSPQVADTGRFQVAWQTPFRLEIFDKVSFTRLRLEDGRRFQFQYQFQAVKLRLLDHTLIHWHAEQGLQIQKGDQTLSLRPWA